jgi:hypothetical protein
MRSQFLPPKVEYYNNKYFSKSGRIKPMILRSSNKKKDRMPVSDSSYLMKEDVNAYTYKKKPIGHGWCTPSFCLLTCEECHTPTPKILTGYRPELNVVESFASVFTLHNETCNIWTHAIPCFAFMVLFCIEAADTSYDSGDKLIILGYIFSAVLCFGLSTIYHTLSCHSDEMNNFMVCVTLQLICMCNVIPINHSSFSFLFLLPLPRLR